jgi:hypothetical protein
VHISTVNRNPYSTILARFDICGFLVSCYPYFVALLHVPHPSSHLHHANAPVPHALFQSAFRIARSLQQNPTATADELMSSVDASVRIQHDANARANWELNLPDCSGGWFAGDLKHLRLVDWDAVLPFRSGVRKRLGNDLFIRLMSNIAAVRKECWGSAICQHNIRRCECKDCGGSAICRHNRRRCECKDCGGSAICQYYRRKRQCNLCRGIQTYQRKNIKCKSSPHSPTPKRVLNPPSAAAAGHAAGAADASPNKRARSLRSQ